VFGPRLPLVLRTKKNTITWDQVKTIRSEKKEFWLRACVRTSTYVCVGRSVGRSAPIDRRHRRQPEGVHATDIVGYTIQTHFINNETELRHSSSLIRPEVLSPKQ